MAVLQHIASGLHDKLAGDDDEEARRHDKPSIDNLDDFEIKRYVDLDCFLLSHFLRNSKVTYNGAIGKSPITASKHFNCFIHLMRIPSFIYPFMKVLGNCITNVGRVAHKD
jgi:hypothetical protein